jgi:hypothetical protein
VTYPLKYVIVVIIYIHYILIIIKSQISKKDIKKRGKYKINYTYPAFYDVTYRLIPKLRARPARPSLNPAPTALNFQSPL